MTIILINNMLLHYQFHFNHWIIPNIVAEFYYFQIEFNHSGGGVRNIRI